MRFKIKLLLFIFAVNSCKPTIISNEKTKINDFLLKKDYTGNCKIYIVHPKVCGGCSKKLVKKLILLNDKTTYIISTSSFEKKDSIYSPKIKIVSPLIIGRLGLSTQESQLLKMVNGKLKSVELI